MRKVEKSMPSSTYKTHQTEDTKTRTISMMKWDEFINLCDDLYKKLVLKNYNGIISIGRGGTIVGAIMASKLGAKIYPVFVVHRGEGEDKSTEIVRLGATEDLKGGRYLLVDDKCVTGETFDLLRKALPNLHLETAAIVCLKDHYSPDYCSLLVDEETVFPYELPF
ncbi:phosphoribosyltransferase [Candidatus Bathyarchaeota archaeon]|nr:phosphoribosyltransferase [Candidatus Bathyarchaeota archaeon]